MRLIPCLAAAAVPLCACTSSALLRPDDRGLLSGQTRVARSAELAQKSGASPAEQAAFLQAESVYQYRPALTGPAAGSYALQLAAAAVDFAPLIALSAQSSYELRLSAYSMSAQLYELQLARFPKGPLAPLALYRLGFAYRNTTLDGFPRGSDEAVAELARQATPLAALAPALGRAPWRSPDTAVSLSLLPGLGQIYCGEVGNGSVRLGISAALAGVAVAPLVLVATRGLTWQKLAISTAGFVGLEVSYTSAYQDAQRSAIAFNEREEAAFAAAHPEAP